MPDSNQAVFLSYASQDAEAARKICEALRAAGVEVWFDQSELRGGDAWDQKIRKQVKACDLFIPIVSANTQARREGYFRLEWKLADDRTALMAKGTPFLVPVCVDDTKDWDAIVPDSFTVVQWTRLRPAGYGGQARPDAAGHGGQALDEAGVTAFAARVRVLLSGEQTADDGRQRADDGRPRAESGGRGTTGRRPSKAAWIAGIAAAAVLAGVVGQQFLQREKPAVPTAPTSGTPPPAAPRSEGLKLADRARALYDRTGFNRDDLVLAEEFARRATDAEPTSGYCWGVRAHVQAAFLFRGFATGDEFVQRSRDAQSFANRATTLQPDEAEALLALGRVATYRRALAQAESLFNRALAAYPDDNRIRRALGTMLRYTGRRIPEAVSVLQEAVRREPRSAIARYDLSMAYRDASNFAAAWEENEAALAIESFGSALTQKASLALRNGDLVAMRDALERLSSSERTEDRSVFYAMWCGLLERKPDRVLEAAALTARDYLEDSSYAGPKAWFPAWALQFAGRDNSARLQWEKAEAVLRARLQADPQNQTLRVQLATTLAWAGRADEARRELAGTEPAWREQMNVGRARALAQVYAAFGDGARVANYLRLAMTVDSFQNVSGLGLDPRWDRVRATPEFVALLAAPPDVPRQDPTPYLPKTVASTPAVREAEKIAERIYETLASVGFTRDSLAVAEDQARQATEWAPELARAWSARARVHAAFVQRTWDGTPARRQNVQTFATRALTLNPDDADAMIAQAIVLDTQGGSVQAEPLLRRAMELRPADPAIRRLLATSIWRQGRVEEQVQMARETVRLFPNDPLAHYDLGVMLANPRPKRDAAGALTSFERAIELEPNFSGALLSKTLMQVGGRGDLAGAWQTLQRLAPADRTEDRAVSVRMWVALLQGRQAEVDAAAALTTRPYFEDTYFFGPKTWMQALAAQMDGKEATARLHWQAAETAMRARVTERPNDLREKIRLWTTLAWLGRQAEVAAETAALLDLLRETPNPFLIHDAARFYAGVGDARQAVPLLRRVVDYRDTFTDYTLPLDPWWMKLRGQPEFEAFLAEANARVAQEKKP